MILSTVDWNLKATKKLTQLESQSEIPLSLIGSSFTSPYQIIELINVEGIKPSWDYGGEIWAANIVKGKVTYHHKNFLRVDNRNYCYFPLTFDNSNFSLYYKSPKWFCGVTVKVYEYTGNIVNEPLIGIINEQFTTLTETINELITTLEVSVDIEQLSNDLTPLLDNLNTQQLQDIQQALNNQTTQIKEQVSEQINPTQDINVDLSFL